MSIRKEEKYIDSDGQELTKKTSITGDIYYINKQGQKHRLDGPAVSLFNGYVVNWFKGGNCHREDGPAIIYNDGREEYWLNGEIVNKKEIDLIWLKKQVDK